MANLVRISIAMRAMAWVCALGRYGAATILVAVFTGCTGAGNASAKFTATPATSGNATALTGGSSAATALVDAQYRFRAAVYHPLAPKRDLHALVERLAGEQFAVVADEAVAKQTARATIAVDSPSIADFPPPDDESLEYFSRGLSARDKAALRASRAVTVFSFRGPGSNAATQYRAALQFVAAFVRELGGYPWDEESRRVFTPESWQALLEHWQGNEPKIPDHIVLHAYRDGELIRIVSLGMVKFGLPDLTINQVSSEDQAMATVANLICQTLFERGKLDSGGNLVVSIDDLTHSGFKAELLERTSDNAKRHVGLRLAAAFPEKGDADNRLLEVVFPGSAKSLQEKQAAARQELFGGHDSIVRVQHDRALLEASERARKKAQAIGKRYAKGPPFGEQLMVKSPFKTTDGSNEWMWVEVVRWNGDKIEGILQNDPFDVPSLKSGSRVEVKASEIFDYELSKSDGSSEGNETGKLLEAREEAGAEVRTK